MEHVSAAPGEPTSCEALYRTHYTRVRRLCGLLLADSCEGEDVAREVFLKLLQAHKTETRPIAWEPWLTRVALNACHDRQRSGWWKWWRGSPNVDAKADRPALDFTSPRPTPEEAVCGREMRWRIRQAYRELSARQQEVFALRYLEGWSTEAIAELLGLTAGSVKQHLFRAVHRLRRRIGGD